MDLNFPTVLVMLPDLPGATALGVSGGGASGRTQDRLVPPTLIAATLRALRRRPGADEPDAEWLEEVERDDLAVRDLSYAATEFGLCYLMRVGGARSTANRPHPIWSSAGWIDEGNDHTVVPMSVVEAQLWQWRLCADAVRSDLDRDKEAPGDALDRIALEYAAANAKVGAGGFRHRLRIEADYLASSTWPMPMAEYWIVCRDVMRAYEAARDFVAAFPPCLEHVSALRLSIEGGHAAKMLRHGAVLTESRRRPGMLLGVRIGGDGEMKPIDTRFMERPHFELSDDEAKTPGVRWVDVCVDREKLWQAFPPKGEATAGHSTAAQPQPAGSVVAAPMTRRAGRPRKKREAAKPVILDLWPAGGPVPTLHQVNARLKALKGDVQSVGSKCFNEALQEVRSERALGLE